MEKGARNPAEDAEETGPDADQTHSQTEEENQAKSASTLKAINPYPMIKPPRCSRSGKNKGGLIIIPDRSKSQIREKQGGGELIIRGG